MCFGGFWAAPMSGIPQILPWEFDRDEVNALNVGLRNFPDDPEEQDRAGQKGCDLAKALILENAAQVALVAEELERRGELLAGDVARLLAPRLFPR